MEEKKPKIEEILESFEQDLLQLSNDLAQHELHESNFEFRYEFQEKFDNALKKQNENILKEKATLSEFREVLNKQAEWFVDFDSRIQRAFDFMNEIRNNKLTRNDYIIDDIKKRLKRLEENNGK